MNFSNFSWVIFFAQSVLILQNHIPLRTLYFKICKEKDKIQFADFLLWYLKLENST